MQPSEEIKSRLDIVDVIREYIHLKPAGTNFRAPCPFHKEKTPSFMVSPDRQIWHCFGCGRGGDVFSFVMEMEGVSFIEALRDLAPKAGVTLKKSDPKMSSQRNRLLDIVETSARFYNAVLRESKQAEAARAYLKKRGLTEDAIQEWQIGFSPDSWDSLITVLIKRGFKEEEIFLSGMTIRRDKRPGFYDRFRGRIMFPINDVNGNPVAFTARVSPEKEETEKLGKYINSPQTQIYDKSAILFGLDKAKLSIKQNNYAILVEGQMDVITAHENGFKNVVAASGTALTEQQIKLLKRFSNNIILAFDMDAAGEQAAERGMREAMRAEMNIKIIELPEGRDPDDYIREDKDGFGERIKNAKPMMRYFFDKTFSRLDLKEIDDKRRAAAKLLPVIARLGNKIEQDAWLKDLTQVLDINENVLRETFSSMKSETDIRPKDAKHSQLPQKKDPTSREAKASELLLALLLKFPFLIEYSINHIEIEHIWDEFNKGLYKNIIFYYNNLIEEWTATGAFSEPPVLAYDDFKAWLRAEESNTNSDYYQSELGTGNNAYQLKKIDRLVFLADEEFVDYSQEQAKSELVNMIFELKRIGLTKKLKELEMKITQAEKNQDQESLKQILSQFKSLTDEYREHMKK